MKAAFISIVEQLPPRFEVAAGSCILMTAASVLILPMPRLGFEKASAVGGPIWAIVVDKNSPKSSSAMHFRKRMVFAYAISSSRRFALHC